MIFHVIEPSIENIQRLSNDYLPPKSIQAGAKNAGNNEATKREQQSNRHPNQKSIIGPVTFFTTVAPKR